MKPTTLSVENGIKIQQKQLREWKTKLIPQVYKALKERAEQDNHLAKSGYDIFRGSNLDNFIANYKVKEGYFIIPYEFEDGVYQIVYPAAEADKGRLSKVHR